MREPTPAEVELMRQIVEEEICPHVVAIAIGDGPDENARLIDQGTGTLVDTGKRRLLLTAAHVVEGWKRDARAAAIYGGTVGEFARVDEWTVLGSHRGYDVAVIEVPELFDPVSISKRFFPLRWPLRGVAQGDAVAFVGAPGSLRSRERRSLSLSMKILEVTDRSPWSPRFRLDPSDGEPRKVANFNSEHRSAGHGAAGMSGAGVFKRGDDEAWLLCGVITECGTIGDGPEVVVEDNAITASFGASELAGLLEQDGTINEL